MMFLCGAEENSINKMSNSLSAGHRLRNVDRATRSALTVPISVGESRRLPLARILEHLYHTYSTLKPRNQ